MTQWLPPGDDRFAYDIKLSTDDGFEEIASLDSVYNPLENDYGYTLPPTRNQLDWSTCWAFSSISLAEIQQALKGKSYDYSERHLAYFTFNPGDDPQTNHISE